MYQLICRLPVFNTLARIVAGSPYRPITACALVTPFNFSGEQS